jgi:exo-beta-1,3-glucanase (GH17 family)
VAGLSTRLELFNFLLSSCICIGIIHTNNFYDLRPKDLFSHALMKSKQGIESAQSAAYAGRIRRKWLFFGAALLFIGLNCVGVGVAIMMVRARRAQTATSSENAGSTAGPPNSLQSNENMLDNQTITSNDPSVFEKDSRLKRSFYGLAYTPEGSQLPECGNSLENIVKDIQLMSQLTTRVRLYGADCNQSALVLEAIRQTKVDMGVFLANYPVPEDPTAYTRQRDLINEALRIYGPDHVLGVTVGNEFLLNYLRAHNATNPNSAIASPAVDMMRYNIQDTRVSLAGLNLPKVVPVGTAEAGSFFNKEILGMVDYGMSNVHAWFANRTIHDAAKWTLKFYEKKNLIPANALANHPEMFIAEAGWPTVCTSSHTVTIALLIQLNFNAGVIRCLKRQQWRFRRIGGKLTDIP